MRRLTQSLLLLTGSALALWLILGFWPLATSSRTALSMAVIIFCTITGYVLWRRDNHHHIAYAHISHIDLPPEDFVGAVVLVCGDTTSLFSPSVSFREARQGWYLVVQLPEHLPALAQHLATERPALISRISVLLALVPEHHQRLDDFTQSLRAWHRAIAQCKAWFSGIPPVWINCWLSPSEPSAQGAECWFTVTPVQMGIHVREAGAGVMPLREWSHLRDSEKSHKRLSTILTVESLLSWFHIHVANVTGHKQGDLPPLIPCVWGFCLTPVQGVENNLWQAHITGITTLRPAITGTVDCLPLPDVLLPYLARRNGVSRLMQLWQQIGLLCGAFLLFAMLALFLNNQRLVQSIGDHLSLFYRLPPLPPTPKVHAQQQLRADAHLLDEWLRMGAPMRLSLGLYQGMRLIAPLQAAINSWAAPPPVVQKIVQGPKTIRLDSLSLFDVGKWQLKAGSTKVLINALVGIKGRPGWLIIVAGHTDDTGDETANQLLSLKRAQSVRDWMRDTGEIPESCFAVQGYGETRPLKPNDTEEGRAANRRVEISLVPQVSACRIPGKNAVSPDVSDTLMQ